MTAARWIRIGKAAAIVLSVIAAFLGVFAVMLVLSMVPSLFTSPLDRRGTEIAMTVVLLVCLCAAVTPFAAVRFFLQVPQSGAMDARQRRSAGQVGVVMSVVAVPWWLVVLAVIWENVMVFDNFAHLVFQALLMGAPATLATVCAVAAFRLRGVSTDLESQ